MHTYKYRHRETYKDRKIDVKADTKTDLISKAAEARRKIDEGYVKESDITLTQWISIWLRTYKEPSVSVSWYRELERRTRPLIDAIGWKKLASVTASDLRKYLNQYAGKSEKYIKTNYTLIKDVFRTAQLDGKINRNPADGLTMPKGKETKQRRSLTEREQELFLIACEGNDIEYVAKMMYYCGLRPGEALALTRQDIDFDSGIVSVTKALKKDGTIGDPKSTAGKRKVPMPKKFTSELKNALKTKSGGLLAKPITMWTIEKRWREIARRMQDMDPSIDSSDLQLYMLRHTYCTNLEKAGVPINIAKVLMGHSSIQMTARIYTHFDDQTLEIARSMIDA